VIDPKDSVEKVSPSHLLARGQQPRVNERLQDRDRAGRRSQQIVAGLGAPMIEMTVMGGC
jgi:hypothetical protein